MSDPTTAKVPTPHFDAEMKRRMLTYLEIAEASAAARGIIENDELQRAAMKLEAMALRCAANLVDERIAKRSAARALTAEGLQR